MKILEEKQGMQDTLTGSFNLKLQPELGKQLNIKQNYRENEITM